MHSLKPLDSNFLSRAPELEVSLLIPARNSGHTLEATVGEALSFFTRAFGNSFEIILIPNPGKGDTGDRSMQVASALAASHPEVRLAPHHSLPGKGAALRTGLRIARGRWIFFTDADLPYDLDFFERATERLHSGYSLVTGNRRLSKSYFNVPVSLLPVAYGRHRLGMAFNRAVRLLLPLQTTDTQAGIKAMSRELARAAFRTMECPGFFFDLEIFLSAHGRGCKQIELPVTLHLNSEKSTVRILRDSFLAIYWLSRILIRHLRGDYEPARGESR